MESVAVEAVGGIGFAPHRGWKRHVGTEDTVNDLPRTGGEWKRNANAIAEPAVAALTETSQSGPVLGVAYAPKGSWRRGSESQHQPDKGWRRDADAQGAQVGSTFKPITLSEEAKPSNKNWRREAQDLPSHSETDAIKSLGEAKRNADTDTEAYLPGSTFKIYPKAAIEANGGPTGTWRRDVTEEVKGFGKRDAQDGSSVGHHQKDVVVDTELPKEFKKRHGSPSVELHQGHVDAEPIASVVLVAEENGGPVAGGDSIDVTTDMPNTPRKRAVGGFRPVRWHLNDAVVDGEASLEERQRSRFPPVGWHLNNVDVDGSADIEQRDFPPVGWHLNNVAVESSVPQAGQKREADPPVGSRQEPSNLETCGMPGGRKMGDEKRDVDDMAGLEKRDPQIRTFPANKDYAMLPPRPFSIPTPRIWTSARGIFVRDAEAQAGAGIKERDAQFRTLPPLGATTRFPTTGPLVLPTPKTVTTYPGLFGRDADAKVGETLGERAARSTQKPWKLPYTPTRVFLNPSIIKTLQPIKTLPPFFTKLPFSPRDDQDMEKRDGAAEPQLTHKVTLAPPKFATLKPVDPTLVIDPHLGYTPIVKIPIDYPDPPGPRPFRREADANAEVAKTTYEKVELGWLPVRTQEPTPIDCDVNPDNEECGGLGKREVGSSGLGSLPVRTQEPSPVDCNVNPDNEECGGLRKRGREPAAPHATVPVQKNAPPQRREADPVAIVEERQATIVIPDIRTAFPTISLPNLSDLLTNIPTGFTIGNPLTNIPTGDVTFRIPTAVPTLVTAAPTSGAKKLAVPRLFTRLLLAQNAIAGHGYEHVHREVRTPSWNKIPEVEKREIVTYTYVLPHSQDDDLGKRQDPTPPLPSGFTPLSYPAGPSDFTADGLAIPTTCRGGIFTVIANEVFCAPPLRGNEGLGAGGGVVQSDVDTTRRATRATLAMATPTGAASSLRVPRFISWALFSWFAEGKQVGKRQSRLSELPLAEFTPLTSFRPQIAISYTFTPPAPTTCPNGVRQAGATAFAEPYGWVCVPNSDDSNSPAATATAQLTVQDGSGTLAAPAVLIVTPTSGAFERKGKAGEFCHWAASAWREAAQRSKAGHQELKRDALFVEPEEETPRPPTPAEKRQLGDVILTVTEYTVVATVTAKAAAPQRHAPRLLPLALLPWMGEAKREIRTPSSNRPAVERQFLAATTLPTDQKTATTGPQPEKVTGTIVDEDDVNALRGGRGGGGGGGSGALSLRPPRLFKLLVMAVGAHAEIKRALPGTPNCAMCHNFTPREAQESDDEDNGYNSGYAQGLSDGREDADNGLAFDLTSADGGHDDGYYQGYAVGYSNGFRGTTSGQPPNSGGGAPFNPVVGGGALSIRPPRLFSWLLFAVGERAEGARTDPPNCSTCHGFAVGDTGEENDEVAKKGGFRFRGGGSGAPSVKPPRFFTWLLLAAHGAADVNRQASTTGSLSFFAVSAVPSVPLEVEDPTILRGGGGGQASSSRGGKGGIVAGGGAHTGAGSVKSRDAGFRIGSDINNDIDGLLDKSVAAALVVAMGINFAAILTGGWMVRELLA
jgi:hypothetical protein